MNSRSKLLIIIVILLVAIMVPLAVLTLVSSPQKAPTTESQPKANSVPKVNQADSPAPAIYITAKSYGANTKMINYTVVVVNPNNVTLDYMPDVNLTLVLGNAKIYSRWIALNMTGGYRLPPQAAINFYSGTIDLPPNSPSGVYWLVATSEDTPKIRVISIPTAVII